MTPSARFLLRRVMVAGHSVNAVTSATRTTAATTARATITTSTAATTTRRLFGAHAKKIIGNSSSTEATAAADAFKYDNLVEESIKKLLTTNANRENEVKEDLKPISNEDLEIRLNYYQKVFEEAESCLSDLRETLFEVDNEQYIEECSCAEGAVNNAFTAYMDLLEDLRKSNEEQLQAYSEERNTNAGNLKRLRKELDQIIEVAENRDRASS